ncbi:MAG: hypothetical protein IJN49_01395 [Clostridia bacterium]|nr:hypothetical protein [Clostridia bacterium]
MKWLKSFVIVFFTLLLLEGCEKESETLFMDILNNKQSFVTENNQDIYLKDFEFSDGYYSVPTEYSFVDFNGDNKNEMIVNLSKDSVAYLVLHQEENSVYGFLFYRRELQQIKTNGTFSSTAGAGYTSYHKLNFKDKQCAIIDMAVVDNYKGEYLINGFKCSQNEVLDFVENFNMTQNIEWIKF